MQQNIFASMRSLKMVEGCKSSPVCAIPPPVPGSGVGRGGTGMREKLFQHIQDQVRVNSIRSKSIRTPTASQDVLAESLLPYGLPATENIEPRIETCLKSVDFVEMLARAYRNVQASTQLERSDAYLEQCAMFMGLDDSKLFSRSLRSARQHAVDVNTKVVLAAWLRYERREDELIGTSSMDCCRRNLECPRANLVPGYDPESVFERCACSRSHGEEPDVGNVVGMEYDQGSSGFKEQDDDDDDGGDMSLCVGDEEVRCCRHNMAMLSRPFKTMLYGGFCESHREKVSFAEWGISIEALRAIEAFSRTRKLSLHDPRIALELLSFANRFCCDEIKTACDGYLSSLVTNMDEAIVLIEYGLEEAACLLVATCLQLILRESPASMQDPKVLKLFCSSEAREKLAQVGHASFALYLFLSQIAMEIDMKSTATVMLLERLVECAANNSWQKQLALHQLGIVMLERKEYKDAQRWFEAAVEVGHVYSLVGVARAKYKRGHKYAAFKIMNSLISDHPPSGWMYQERSLYCVGQEKIADLVAATRLDPTLSFPYKYRAAMLFEENKIGASVSEINKIIRFKVSPDCLELRAWLSIMMQDYDAALRDVRALLTLDSNYMMFNGKMNGDQLVELLQPHVQESNLADCWMQLYDRWSCVDDIGSLAVVHQMLQNDPGRSLLRFRQSLLLLR
ncbi:hypothetical protein MLD38_023924 [Melastoma candidum]|nr:hypothetical protein MLD38_023924 [Melastoma candidum]